MAPLNDKPLSWWVSNRDRMLLGAAAIMFGLLMWSIPKELQAMREEHAKLLMSNQILCVHQAETDHERTECLTLTLFEQKK